MNGTLTDVAGVKVGHFTDSRRPTGCTVIRVEEGATGAVDVRGAAPGTRETDLLAPGCLVERVHAVLLTGGSAFGLDAATGVMQWLEANGYGHQAGPARVPIVPAAVLFDLLMGDMRIRPDAAAGYAACAAAHDGPVSQGSVGAGAGAVVGKLRGAASGMKGGLGSASMRIGQTTVGAIVAVNALGDIVDPDSGQWLAGARSADGKALRPVAEGLWRGEVPGRPPVASATTIGLIATDAALDKVQAGRLAMAGHDGLARTIRPVHTQWDGDTVFALATHRKPAEIDVPVLAMMAAEVMARAVVNAIRQATRVSGPGVPDLPAWRERNPNP